MTEAELTKKIRADLKAIGAKAIKVRGARHTEPGTPDILGSWRGQFFAIEVKVGRNKCSAIQEQRLAEWAATGSVVVVAYEDWDVQAFMEKFNE